MVAVCKTKRRCLDAVLPSIVSCMTEEGDSLTVLASSSLLCAMSAARCLAESGCFQRCGMVGSLSFWTGIQTAFVHC